MVQMMKLIMRSIHNSTKKAQFGHVVVKLGKEFLSLDTFKDAIKDYNIYLRRPIYFSKMILLDVEQYVQLNNVNGYVCVHLVTTPTTI